MQNAEVGTYHEDAAYITGRIESTFDREVEEYGGKLGVRQGQGPKSEVAGRVRDRTKHKFNRFDQLVDHENAEAVILFVHFYKLVFLGTPFTEKVFQIKL